MLSVLARRLASPSITRTCLVRATSTYASTRSMATGTPLPSDDRASLWSRSTADARIADHHSKYENPLVGRYTSAEMNYNWSPQKKFSTWRRMWVALAQAQHELGLPQISAEQLDEMRRNIDNIDFAAAAAYERELRHDVMAHIHAFGDQCPKARPIIHLGATSCFVGDNTDLIQMRDGMQLLKVQLLQLIKLLRGMCLEYKDLPTLGFTHYQPAQLTTYGTVHLARSISLSRFSLARSLTR